MYASKAFPLMSGHGCRCAERLLVQSILTHPHQIALFLGCYFLKVYRELAGFQRNGSHPLAPVCQCLGVLCYRLRSAIQRCKLFSNDKNLNSDLPGKSTILVCYMSIAVLLCRSITHLSFFFHAGLLPAILCKYGRSGT